MAQKILFPVLILILAVSGCRSGKKSFERGEYYQAVLQSVNRLRKNPDNRKAKSTLHQGYPLAKEYHEELARRAKISADPLKWETVHNQYRLLNTLYDEIKRCPNCLSLAKSARSYQTEMDEAALKAAEVRYAMGDEAMGFRSREKAKDAYNHYQVADSYRPNFRDTQQKMQDARWAATLKVVVEPIPMHSRAMEISNDFFQGQIDEFLANANVSPFVAFFSPKQAYVNGIDMPDHVVSMQFDDFVVGQHFVKEKVEKVSRDSVIIGYTDKSKDTPIYGTVTAELRTMHKEVVSSGLLNFEIQDSRSNRRIIHDKFPGTYVWFCDWGSFNGDERALTDAQMAMVKGRELMPPPPQQLFIEFTKPIYGQITGRLADFYRNF